MGMSQPPQGSSVGPFGLIQLGAEGQEGLTPAPFCWLSSPPSTAAAVWSQVVKVPPASRVQVNWATWQRAC